MSWMIGKVHQKALFARSRGEVESLADVSHTHCIYLGKLVVGKLPRHSAGWPIPFMMTYRNFFDSVNGLWNRGDSI